MIDDVLCVIPARGGSKSIPGKNLKKLADIPLVEYSIQQAIKSGISLENIILSSDDDKILEIATFDKIVPLRRPAEISGDLDSTELALLHALEKHSLDRKSVDYVLLLQPTSPIRFRGMIEKFIKFGRDHDSALTATKLYDFFWFKNHNGKWDPTYKYYKRPMRQELRPEQYKYFENGNAYLTKASILRDGKCRLDGKIGIFPISELEAMQIDTLKDFEILDAILEGHVCEQI